MPQPIFTPSVPDKAAQRGGAWSVPRMRQVLAVTSTANPLGTAPPSAWVSNTEKSTRKLAQQAPQDVQADMGFGVQVSTTGGCGAWGGQFGRAVHQHLQ